MTVEPTVETLDPTPDPVEPTPEETTNESFSDAEALCAGAYDARGVAPQADSGDIDDEMALEAKWQADLLTGAVEELRSLGGDQDLLALMEEYADLSMQAGVIYADHPLYSQDLDQINSRRDQIVEEIPAVADAAGAPSCAKLVVLPD